jgi:putative phosphoesterase
VDKKINLNDLIKKSEITVGVLSDTHNQLNDFIIASLKNCDAIIHAGDIGDADVLDNLNTHTDHVFSVRGNNDTEEKWPAHDLHTLANIPDNLELAFENKVIAVTHGHQFYKVETRHDQLRNQFPHADIIVYGHSHRIACDQQQEPWVINPGAGGHTRTFGGASCMMLKYKDNHWDIEQFRFNE